MMSVSVRFEVAVTLLASVLIAAAFSACATGDTPELLADAGDRSDDAPSPDAAVDPAPVSDARAADAAPPDGPLAACAPASLAPGDDTVIQLTHDGVSRQYNVHVGTTVDPDEPVPLLLNFHGANNSAGIQELFSRMKGVADAEGFVVVYPSGLNSTFNAGSCCGQSAASDVDDLGFARAIVVDVSQRLCIDARRVYATGFSNGGYMSHYLACHASDVFAAVAPVAGAMGTANCSPGRAVPVIAFHGTADFVVPHASGRRAAEEWSRRNGCAATAVRESFGRSYCDVWSGCDDGGEVEFCSVSGFTHLWPGASTAIPASPRIWDFLSRHQLPASGEGQ